MIDLGWSAPNQPVDAGTARQAILWQHEQIRGFLVKASEVAELALDGEAAAPDAVASAIGDLHAMMEVHLTFEEKILLPLLRDDPPLGPRRADQLLHEHQQHRQTLSTLHLEACAHPELPTLAAKLVLLTAWLRADMTEEERCLMFADVPKNDLRPRTS